MVGFIYVIIFIFAILLIINIIAYAIFLLPYALGGLVTGVIGGFFIGGSSLVGDYKRIAISPAEEREQHAKILTIEKETERRIAGIEDEINQIVAGKKTTTNKITADASLSDLSIELSEEGCAKILSEAGYKIMKTASNTWVINEPLGGREKINSLKELKEYAVLRTYPFLKESGVTTRE